MCPASLSNIECRVYTPSAHPTSVYSVSSVHLADQAGDHGDAARKAPSCRSPARGAAKGGETGWRGVGRGEAM